MEIEIFDEEGVNAMSIICYFIHHIGIKSSTKVTEYAHSIPVYKNCNSTLVFDGCLTIFC